MTLNVTIPSDALLPWESQVGQYAPTGEPGITYFKGEVDDGKWVDCLLWRDDDGVLRGVLNHYPFDLPPWEVEGNYNLFTDPQWRRRGIGLALLTEADRRYRLDFDQQSYTPEGAALAEHYLQKKEAMKDDA